MWNPRRRRRARSTPAKDRTATGSPGRRENETTSSTSLTTSSCKYADVDDSSSSSRAFFISRFARVPREVRARAEPFEVVDRPVGVRGFDAEYFAEQVRRRVYDRYGVKKLYGGGLSIRIVKICWMRH